MYHPHMYICGMAPLQTILQSTKWLLQLTTTHGLFVPLNRPRRPGTFPLTSKYNLLLQQIVVLSAKRLLQLINDVLDAATLKQGTMVIKHETVSAWLSAMCAVCRAMCAMCVGHVCYVCRVICAMCVVLCGMGGC